MASKRRCKTYYVWSAMKQRCLNPNDPHFHNYGGRGIKVCDRWMLYDDFLEDMGHAPKGLSIDRINNDGNYEPDNCQWANRKQQQRNMSVNRYISCNGETKLLVEWAELKGISANTILYRLRRGWSEDRAVNEPVNENALQKQRWLKSWQARRRNCLTCNEVFYPRKYQIENGDGKYCSRSCIR